MTFYVGLREASIKNDIFRPFKLGFRLKEPFLSEKDPPKANLVVSILKLCSFCINLPIFKDKPAINHLEVVLRCSFYWFWVDRCEDPLRRGSGS